MAALCRQRHWCWADVPVSGRRGYQGMTPVAVETVSGAESKEATLSEVDGAKAADTCGRESGSAHGRGDGRSGEGQREVQDHPRSKNLTNPMWIAVQAEKARRLGWTRTALVRLPRTATRSKF